MNLYEISFRSEDEVPKLLRDSKTSIIFFEMMSHVVQFDFIPIGRLIFVNIFVMHEIVDHVVC